MKKLTIALAALLPVAAIAQTDFTRTVATINGEEIKGPEYYKRMEYLPGVGKMIGQSFAQAPPGFLALDQIINERLLLQLAREKGVYPTDAEVKQELKLWIENNPNMLETAAASGMAESDMEYQVRLSMAQFKLQTRGITVTDQELEKFYKDNPTTFTLPKTIELRIVVVDTDSERSAVDSEVKAGKPFVEVAKTYNKDLILKASGGAIGPKAAEAFDPEIRAAIDKVKVGQVTDWVPTRGKYWRASFEKANPAKTIPLDDKLRLQLRRKLMLDRGRVKPENDLSKMMSNMRAKSKIDIADKKFAETFQKMMGVAARGPGG